MRRGICCVYVCVTLALTASYDAQAQSKKKGKEPELAISKRGKLIFEDDFSGKELLWNFDANRCKWEIVKKAALTKSKGTSGDTKIERAYTQTSDVIFEFKTLLPLSGDLSLFYAAAIRDTPWAKIFVTPSPQSAIYVVEADEQHKALVLSPLVYRKPRWLNVTFEVLGSRYALTVDGTTTVCDFPASGRRQATFFAVGMNKKSDDVFAIDDVKVWEALPKDEEPEKDKKTKK
ncbi:MAG: hypothetical protein AB1696_04760 [Planctomycetota bacterium]